MQSTREEMNESLGTYLKRSREAKNVSIEQVAYATRISLKMLRALEEDDHSALPASTFVRGYLQAYAKYVRLDTQDLLLRYQHHLATVPDSKRGAIRSHYLYVRERYQEKRRLVMVIALFALMLTVAGAYFFLKAQREKRKHLGKMVEIVQKSEEAKPTATLTSVATETATSVSKETAKAVNEKKPVEKLAEPEKAVTPPPVAVVPPPAPAPAPAPPPPPVVETKAPVVVVEPVVPATPAGQTKNFNLLLRATEDVWFRYQTDSDEVKDLTLRAGKAMMLRADKVVKIFSGNLNAMKATLNGKELAALANAKGVKSAVLPESEAPNYPLPLFPQFQTKTPPPASGAGRTTPTNATPPPVPSNSTEPPSP